MRRASRFCSTRRDRPDRRAPSPRRERRSRAPPGPSGRTSRSRPEHEHVEGRDPPPRAPPRRGTRGTPRPGADARARVRLGPSPDDDEPRAGNAVQGGKVLDLLLGSEPADVADEELAVRGELRAKRVRPLGRVESLAVDAPGPELDRGRRPPVERGDRGARRRERQGRPAVDPRDVRLQRRGETRVAVPLRVAGDVGLVDRDGRDAEVIGGAERLPAEEERRCEVDDVRLDVPRIASRRPRGREGEADLRVSRCRHRAECGERGAVEELLGRRARAARRDDDGPRGPRPSDAGAPG